MIKEGIKRTAVMLGVYLLCVGSVLAILIYNFRTFETDYTDQVQGTWSAVQYFKNKSVHVYTQEDGFQVRISDQGIEYLPSNGQAPLTGEFVWKNGYSGTVSMEDGFKSFVSIDTNTRGDLKLNVLEKGMIILLRRTEADQQ